MKVHSKPIAEHAEAPLADEGRLEEIIEHWTRREAPAAPERLGAANRCYVVAVSMRGQPANLAEILGLVEAQGDRVVGQETLDLLTPDPRTLLGKGAAHRIGQQARDSGANLLVLDAALTPSQARNLEDVAGISVCDREAVILNVFQKHATTERARVQVEIAHLQYLRPRIRGIGLDMDQQAAGMMKARGPGETASELLARRLDGRLAVLRRSLARLAEADRLQRKKRSRCHRVALVGYTNAGKTSLMNALTSAELSVRNRPFETLDTTSRCLSRHGKEVLLSDTVGFIRRLPEQLLASFESTLGEVREASLLLIVVDSSDPELALHLETTQRVLERLGADAVPRILVLNKIDLLPTPMDEATLQQWSGAHDVFALSAHDAQAAAELRERILVKVRNEEQARTLFVPYAAKEAMDLVHARCRVSSTTARAQGISFELEAEPEVVARIIELVRRSR
ncbi:MAG: GTPase HflX [Polyangiaceae bacterium]